MNEMSVGDVGILQNIPGQEIIYNGMVAEIKSCFCKGTILVLPGGREGPAQVDGYCVSTGSVHGEGLLAIHKHEIRPITSPDEEKETEREKELVK